MDRRDFLTSTIAAGGFAAASSLLPAWAQSAAPLTSAGLPALSGTRFDLNIGRTPVTIDGRGSRAVTVNGHMPAPVLRWREGDELTLNVTNGLDEDSSIHWHGLLLPFQMDGVPGVTFPGIAPGETFQYRFPVRQSGTYWYHSHSGLQEQMGHYGPIIIDPAGEDPISYDREYVLMLGDWTFDGAHTVFNRLKQVPDVYNAQRRTLVDFFRDARREGLDQAVAERAMWARMRMSMTDISDVTAAAYTYLINGHGPQDNWTGLFHPGERVRLRIINASAMTIFNLRIPGLPMTVVQADGLPVQPVETDEFQIGVAETYDVIVEPRDEAYTVMAESIDRSGYVRATLAPRAGMQADVPPLRERPLLSMRDMGMDHSAMGGEHAAMGHDMPAPVDHSTMDHAAMGHAMPEAAAPMDHAAMGHAMPAPAAPMDHAAMGHGTPAPAPAMDHAAMGHGAVPMAGMEAPLTHDHPAGPGVAMMPAMVFDRLGERGIGLADEPHRVLVYTQLKSLEPNPDRRPPGREVEVHLTSNMERYMWSFDGAAFSPVVEPIVFRHNERLRLTLVNDTMMPHPIHLHGMFFDVVTGEDAYKPRKHTIIVKPAERLSVDVTADALGEWAFHCHLLFHMHAGMMQVVSVRPGHGGHHDHI
ncbi:copper resistance system multicopper oxidase [Maricaulis salignorans]|uniref:Copper-resistance protein, CopA family n=1 Tax=Maricaulis salignorans TaxID=144026 RepID=A0A1G9VNA6_9PROT|nr:copper resistance system multicopper oxidase [Maricaulis salignorans]SDM73748.1 copper-resistance protein, CopA family [Maricaulis salignorans]